MAPTSLRRSSSSTSGSGKSKKQSTASEKLDTQNQWVFIANEEILTEDENTSPENKPTICKFKHPRTGLQVCYIISSSGSIYELERFEEKFHSWFIGDQIQSGGQIYFTTPMDSLYLVLPYLINAGKKEKFMSLDQMVCDVEVSACERLLHCLTEQQLSLVADVKECDDLRFYRYNKSKTLDWLKAKVENVVDALETKAVDVGAKGSHSAIFVPSKGAKAPRESYIGFASGLIGDKICLDLEEDLKNYLGVVPESDTKSNQNVSEIDGPPAKKARTSMEVAPTEDYSLGVDGQKGKSQNVKLTAAQKRLSKVDTSGMKSLSSFFSKKN